MLYGYCRVSTNKQNIERQIRNIKAQFPDAVIVCDMYTGTKINRRNFDKLLLNIKPGDTIVFDSVSRMSRNSDEGVDLYLKLYESDVELIFLKEPHINTSTYKNAHNCSISCIGNEIADVYIEATNKVLMLLASQQIRMAFYQAEKEVLDLRKRTKEGIVTARLNGKQIGSAKGIKKITKKSVVAKEIIKKYSRDFNGSLPDKECIKLAQVSRNTYYTYKKQLIAEETSTNDYVLL